MIELKVIENVNGFKDDFLNEFNQLQKSNPSFGVFIYNVLKFKQAYVIGGFLRDLANGLISRDVDILCGLTGLELQYAIDYQGLVYKKNRFNGYKIIFETFDLDCWSYDSNWAFKRKLLKDSRATLDNIAKGTFLNFDSLVINIHTLHINVANYNHCVKSKTLDLLNKNQRYQMYNPTKEANIIRCLYLSKRYGLVLSTALKQYINEHIQTFNLLYGSYKVHLRQFQTRYPKYFTQLSLSAYFEYIEQLRNSITDEKRSPNDSTNRLF